MAASRGTFEHGADVGVWGRGESIPEAFCAAAESVFALMTDIDAVLPRVCVTVRFEEGDVELALVRWLNALLAEAGDAGLALGRFVLERDGDRWSGIGWGEPWRAGLERGTVVKGATLTELAVRQSNGGWSARCVVDV